MSHHPHIINKQIIELALSDKTTAFGTQQQVGQLYTNQLVPVLDRLLDRYFGSDDTHYQIDRLTIDLGSVALENMPQAFDTELAKVLSSIRGTSQVTAGKVIPDTPSTPSKERTPLRVLAHYLDTGRLPWWSGTQKRSYLFAQWELLMQNPTQEFKTLLSQLYHNKTHLDRYLYTFSEEQVLQAAQWITGLLENELYVIRDKVKEAIQQRSKKNTPSFWKTNFLRVLFRPKPEQGANIEEYYIQETLKVLGITSDSHSKVPQYKVIQKIQSLLHHYHRMAPDHRPWQGISKRLHTLLHNYAINKVPVHLLTQVAVLLEEVQEKIATTQSHFDTEPTTLKLWMSLATQLNTIERIVQQARPMDTAVSVASLQSQFEDTDFITVENAGLVLFWPFLSRFFKNLELMEDKDFVDGAARYKAVCALQYLCNPDETELFEGQLPLAKLVCGVPLEEPVPPILLTDEEKEIAHGLLNAVLQQGPHWKNLSIEGFRASYLCRQASLRTRDDHWLLQVQKETYDITLQKLPWSIQAVKLPWMERALMVEWM